MILLRRRLSLILLAFPMLLGPPLALQSETLDLSGPWRFRLDPQDQGLTQQWPAQPLDTPDRITLPNTTDRAGFGFALDPNTLRHPAPFPVTTRFPGVKEPQRADEHGYLVRQHLFVGPAWYEREIDIPASWQHRPVTFHIERALWQTDVWIDGRHVSIADSLVAPHPHPLGPLAVGAHRLTVRVDNRMIHNLSTITHAYGPETQTRWNGMIGRLTLEAQDPVSVRSLQAYPAPDRQSVRLDLHITNTTDRPSNIAFQAELQILPSLRRIAVTSAPLLCPVGLSSHRVTLQLPEPGEPWDEFNPALYRVIASLPSPGSTRSTVETTLGFRHLERREQSLHLNGRRLFLRGTLDCAVYPRTGHPPMDLAEWERVMGVIKEYGFNHVRFHTWCPPEAAFTAADRLGLYLQVEAPAWIDDWTTATVTQPTGLGKDPATLAFLEAEARRIVEAYGNHPSFTLFALGNEFGNQHTDWDRINTLIAELKAADPRRLYAGCTARKNLAADDYWVTHHTATSTRGVGPPNTDWDFTRALSASPVPLIAHETGQRPVFPDFETLQRKFTGPLLPLNLDRYRRLLHDQGLAPQIQTFVRASARFQLTQYKAEHEAMLRTSGYAGYQLLMLNDFTGQSEALVGILDPFWQTKGVISVEEVRAWNSPTVLLARFPKYTWTTDETLEASFQIASFGPQDLEPQPTQWTLETSNGRQLAQGDLAPRPAPTGRLADLGRIHVPLHGDPKPSALKLTVRFGRVQNQWPLWLYPPLGLEPLPPPDLLVTTNLDTTARSALAAGHKVLLLAHGVSNPHAAKTGFESVYWSAGWWGNKFSSLGILCDPAHPALAAFPNEGWSDWQWHELGAGATTFDLGGAPSPLRAIVQPVPDFHFGTPLAQVFEARVGPGSILVCGYDLTRNLDQRPAAGQFRRSLLQYVTHPSFRPTTAVPFDWLEARCTSPAAPKSP